jgi:phage tail tape-measure protein
MQTKILVTSVVAALLLGGCTNMSETQKGTAKGAAIGAGAGAVVGAIAGTRVKVRQLAL